MSRLTRSLPRAAFVLVACATAVLLSACWMAAAPLASSVLSAAGSIGHSTPVNTHANKDTAQDLECDFTNPAWPSLIELRTDKVGTTIYRPLSLSGPGIDLRYEDVDAPAKISGDWRLANDFARLRFTPPLQAALVAPSTSYLAYAPATPRSVIERRQADSLQHEFGPVLGTFKWQGRVYRYALVRRLPCASTAAESQTAASPHQRTDRITPGPQR